MLDPSIRLRRAIHANDALLVARILKTHPSLLRNPDHTTSAGPQARPGRGGCGGVGVGGLGDTNLHLAASLGHVSICRVLVSLGHEHPSPALNALQQTALMAASAGGHTETVHFLCEASAPAHAVVLRRDARGRDAVMEASLAGHDTVVQILLTYAPGGAERAVGRADADGNTALHLASSNGNLLVMRTLLAAGADPTRRNAWDWTPEAYSATVQAQAYLKNLVAEAERRKVARRDEAKKAGAAAGVRIVEED